MGRSILVIIWHLLGPDHHDRHVNTDIIKRTHIRQFKALGYHVTPQKPPPD